MWSENNDIFLSPQTSSHLLCGCQFFLTLWINPNPSPRTFLYISIIKTPSVSSSHRKSHWSHNLNTLFLTLIIILNFISRNASLLAQFRLTPGTQRRQPLSLCLVSGSYPSALNLVPTMSTHTRPRVDGAGRGEEAGKVFLTGTSMNWCVSHSGHSREGKRSEQLCSWGTFKYVLNASHDWPSLPGDPLPVCPLSIL